MVPTSKKVRNLMDIIAESSSQRKKKLAGRAAATKRSMLPARRIKSLRIRNRTTQNPRSPSPPIVISTSPSPLSSAQPSPPRDLPAAEFEDVENQPRREDRLPEPRVRTFHGSAVPASLVKKPRTKLPRRLPSQEPPVLPPVVEEDIFLPLRTVHPNSNSQSATPPNHSNSQAATTNHSNPAVSRPQMSLPYPQSKSFQPRHGGSTNSVQSRQMTPAASTNSEPPVLPPDAPPLSRVEIPELSNSQPRTRSQSPPPVPPFDGMVDNELPVPNNAPKSIRKRASSTGSTTTEEVPVKKKRGVVNGTKLGTLLSNIGPNKKIRLEVGLDGVNPSNRKLRSLLVHAIGAYVKTVVPMNVASFSDVSETFWDDILVHLRCSFEITDDQKWLKTLIMKISANIFRGWKCKCNRFYLANPDIVPEEFQNRPDQWEWLKNHFDDPAFKKKSSQMTRIRENRANHRSGKLPFIYRAQEYMDKGHNAAYLAAFEEVYGGDPLGAPLVAKMRLKLAEFLGGEYDLDSLVDPCPVEAQLEIINEVMGRRKGKPAAGLRRVEAYMDLREELERTKQERLREQEEAAQKEAQSQAMMRNLEERIRALEDQRGGNAATPANAPSEGASYVNPNFVSLG